MLCLNLRSNKTEAEQKTAVLMTKVRGEMDIVENESKTEVLEMINLAQTEWAGKKIKADHDAIVLITKSEAAFEAAKARHEAAMIEAQAEAENKEGLSSLRKHELAMAKAEVLQELAKKTDIIIGGEAGDALLKEFIP